MDKIIPNQSVLIVDDNSAIHEDFRKILQPDQVELDPFEVAVFGAPNVQATAHHFEIDSAYQGKEALEKVCQSVVAGRPYAVVFMDIRMPPGWDGIETTAQLWTQDPDLQVVICSAYTVQPPDGAPSYYEGFFFDLTERRRAEQQRQEMEMQLRQAQKLESVGRLAAGIAHEINTPAQYVGDNLSFLHDSFAELQTIAMQFRQLLATTGESQLSAQALAEARALLAKTDVEYLGREIPVAIKQGLEGVGRISKIVGALREFAHPGNRQKSGTNLNHAIETTVAVARSEWNPVADVAWHLDPKLPLVTCFVGEFNQAILNLIINAAQAIADVVGPHPKQKGVISVQTRRDGSWAEIRIGDTGTGIAESARPHIFEPFFTTKEVGRGTGQGLNVAYHSIVKLNQGTIWFETEVGKGTMFIIRLPLKPV